MSEPATTALPRPWVQLAALCHTALTENTGQLSIIRIVDRWMVVGLTPEMQSTNIQLTMAIILKSDQMRGQYRLRLRLRSPLGNVTEGPVLPALFEGDDRGVQAILPSGILATEPGLYWFEILVEDEVVTRVPLRILYQQIQLPPGGAGLVGPAPQSG
ncbi:MAG: hypothetical protein A3G20_02965 [Acidobacteria bacterium RIFCSPLOWO2_12_FULL_59_11]|nr:MAG: hypothetical protein A3G20_02965 [Acidobacteria bacterium RIFCSPLOWO2_12_FULL_59_11]